MPTYEYICNKCEAVTEVERKIRDYNVPPEEGCKECGSKDIYRGVSTGTSFNLKGSGWFKDGY
jgi:putative FmdB family regulatory protein